MTTEQITVLLRGLGGTPEWLLAEPALLNMMLPPFRADFEVKEEYQHRMEAPLSVPVTAISATEDPRASVADMIAWARHTSADFQLRILPGGHFAPLECVELTRDHISRALSRRALSAKAG